MSTLYIANCTTKKQTFMFLPLEGKGGQHRKIPILEGSQMAVLRGTTEEIAHVLAQHAIYNVIDAQEIPRSRKVVELCYAIDKMVTPSQMMKAQEQNRAILIEQGAEARKRAAIAGHDTAESLTPGNPLHAFETEIVEQVGPTESPRINETLQYAKQGAPPRRGASRKAA